MNPIVQLAANALPGEKKYILFAGAGVSKDAGVPTAWDLMLKTASLLYTADNSEGEPKEGMEKWFINSEYAKLTYSELIGKIYTKPSEQQDFLKQYLTGHKLGEAHKEIAELARRGIIRAIITTNFDKYIENALEEAGLQVQVISTEDDLKNSEPLIHCKAVRIYKPHGDLGKGALKNTTKDLESLDPLMEQELIRILSEHGVIILGYSGIDDLGIQKVFNKRNHNYYPLFWVNPNEPDKLIIDVLKEYVYIPCVGASKFIQEFIKIQERVKGLAPPIKSGPSIIDLEYALKTNDLQIEALFNEYLNNLFNKLTALKPDFTKSENYDDIIFEQIKLGNSITYDFIKSAILASKYKKLTLLQIMYDFFGKILTLYDLPVGFSGQYRTTDFDGFKFLGYEMFVGLVASILKYDNWIFIADLLRKDFFVEKSQESKYISFLAINRTIQSIDDYRNKRLFNSRKIYLSSEIIRDRFNESELSELILHKQFMEADYLLFIRTVCQINDINYLNKVWFPRSCLFLNDVPVYLRKAEKADILVIIAYACGYDNPKDFVNNFSQKHSAFNSFFNYFSVLNYFSKDDPLGFFDFNKLGTLK